MIGGISSILGLEPISLPIPMLGDSLRNAILSDTMSFTPKTAGGNNGGVPSVKDATKGMIFNLYPNPSLGNFTIKTGAAGTLHLSSIEGKELKTWELPAGNTELTLPATLAPGIYIAVYRPADGGKQQIVRLVYEQ